MIQCGIAASFGRYFQRRDETRGVYKTTDEKELDQVLCSKVAKEQLI